MKLSETCVVPAGFGETWDYLLDVANSARCVPGVTEAVMDGAGRYRGTLRARVGPMTLTLHGTVTVQEQERPAGRARFLVEASDRRVGGGVKTELRVQLTARAGGETELSIETDTAFMGRLAELGQPVIRRKAQSAIQEFAQNLRREMAARGAG